MGATIPGVPPRQRPRHYPSEFASCGGCGEVWRGVGIAHCGACHRSFGASSLFDRHRRRDNCVDPVDILDQQGYMFMRLIEGIWRGQEASPEMRARLGR